MPLKEPRFHISHRLQIPWKGSADKHAMVGVETIRPEQGMCRRL
jgi:hypothetical protein